MFEARPSGPDSSLLSRLAPWIVGAFAAVMVCGFLTLDSISPANRRLIKIRGEDPVAYFGTAHSILFDRDFNLSNEFQHVPPDGRCWTADQPATSLPGCPWGLGYSFLEMPLLALGSGIDGLTGHAGDGYDAWAITPYCIGSRTQA